MFIRDFNPKGQTKINKINKLLKEQFNVSIKTSFPKKAKLEAIKEMSQNAIIKLKNTTKQFQLQPEYAKYLGIKDVMDTMLVEGNYAESPKYLEMKDMITANVQELMDSGYTTEEASAECMNRFRQDSRFAHDDEHVLPIVITAAKQYHESSCGTHESLEELVISGPSTDLNEKLLAELAKEIGIDLVDTTSYDAIEEKINMFAEVTGKSRDSVVGFLNGLEEDALPQGIKFFGAKVAEANKPDFLDLDKDGNKTEPMKKAAKDAKKESMFDDILNDMLAEEIEGTTVEEAEVVMAVRALADDIQDHVERLGRMVNEDIPAIADQMIHEFGADRAATFKDSAEQVLAQALESSKVAKEGVNQLVGGITGTAMDVSGLGDTSELGGDIESDLGGDTLDDMAMDVNEPAAAGPEEEPLGRAPVEG
tara:strand:+ start:670 stop:1938 length:1269 start_codon:yes stop_codon:yes gene_type:complete